MNKLDLAGPVSPLRKRLVDDMTMRRFSRETMNSIVAALRFFFTHSLDQPDLARKLVRTARARKIPVVLILVEVKRLLDSTTCLKHRAVPAFVAKNSGVPARGHSYPAQRRGNLR